MQNELLSETKRNEIKKSFIQTLNMGENELIEIAFAPKGTSSFQSAIYYASLNEANFDHILERDENISFCANLTPSSEVRIPINQLTQRKGQDKLIQFKSIVSFDLDFKDNIPNYDQLNKDETCDCFVKIILTKLAGTELEPWLIVFSGHGLHLHYKFATPVPIKIQEYKTIYDGLKNYIEVNTQLKLDPNCSNPSRLMRLPFSTNYKNPLAPIKTQILHYNGNIFIDKLWASFHNAFLPPATILSYPSQYKEALNLIIILEHFSYGKKNTIKEKNGKILCSSPFSKDSNPSFYYDSSKKLFYDFSNQFGGDLLTLIARFAYLDIKNDFAKVLEIADKILGVDLGKAQLNRFYVNDKGVWFQADEKNPSQWLSSPIYIESLTRDVNNKSWGRLLTVVDQDNVKKTWAMPMELLATDGAEIRKNLLHLGAQLAIQSKERQLFLSYLQSFKPSQRSTCVTRIGWHQDEFVLPHKVYKNSKSTRNIILQSKTMECGYEIYSDLKSWQDNVAKYCLGNSIPSYAVCTAFASVLLNLTNEESAGFHFVGPSSIGKSITLKIAASVWGNAGLNGLIKRWRSTLNGLELLATSRCDSLLILDELGELKPQEAGLAAYMICGGVSKNRSSKNVSLDHANQWRLLFLSSGEISLSNHLENSGERVFVGQEVRMINIMAQVHPEFGIFENIHEFSSCAQFAQTLSKNSEKYYGSAIDAFLTKIVEENSVMDKIQNFQKEFTQQIFENGKHSFLHGQIHRVLQRFSLVAAAGELAIAYGILPWPKGEAIQVAKRNFENWLDNWSVSSSKESDKLVQQIRSLLQEFGPSRFPLLDDFKRTSFSNGQKLWGFRIQNGETWEWIILSEIFRNQLCKGFDLKKSIKDLKELGFLAKSSVPMRLPDLGLTRVFVLDEKIVM